MVIEHCATVHPYDYVDTAVIHRLLATYVRIKIPTLHHAHMLKRTRKAVASIGHKDPGQDSFCFPRPCRCPSIGSMCNDLPGTPLRLFSFHNNFTGFTYSTPLVRPMPLGHTSLRNVASSWGRSGAIKCPLNVTKQSALPGPPTHTYASLRLPSTKYGLRCAHEEATRTCAPVLMRSPGGTGGGCAT